MSLRWGVWWVARTSANWSMLKIRQCQSKCRAGSADGHAEIAPHQLGKLAGEEQAEADRSRLCPWSLTRVEPVEEASGRSVCERASAIPHRNLGKSAELSETYRHLSPAVMEGVCDEIAHDLADTDWIPDCVSMGLCDR
jgi:hypothetical protein